MLAFAISAFLFHFANAAMLPQPGEMLVHGRVRDAAPFIAATVTQLVIAVTASTVGLLCARWGPRPLLLFGFAVLPIRAVLYTLTSSIPLLIAIQTLDGVANSIFGVASAVLIADRVRGSGHFNLATGAIGTVVGIGAALRNTVAVSSHKEQDSAPAFLLWPPSLFSLSCAYLCPFRIHARGLPTRKQYPPKQ